MEVAVQEEEVQLEPERPRVVWKIGPLAQVWYLDIWEITISIIRKWISEAFVGILSGDTLLYVWDVIFMYNWSKVVITISRHHDDHDRYDDHSGHLCPALPLFPWPAPPLAAQGDQPCGGDIIIYQNLVGTTRYTRFHHIPDIPDHGIQDIPDITYIPNIPAQIYQIPYISDI